MSVWSGEAMQRSELQHYLDELLEAARFHDYCPNGLQVEGRAEIGAVGFRVTASPALMESAIRCPSPIQHLHPPSTD